MRYISIRELQKESNSLLELSDPVNHSEIIKSLESKAIAGAYQIGNQQYSSIELIQFLSSLDTKKLVFLNWVEQHADLQALLLGEFPHNSFSDKYKWREHALFSEFTAFLFPFLQSSVLKYRGEKSLEKIRIIFSFLVLLPSDERMLTEQELFRSVQERINLSKESIASSKTEEELLRSLQLICNDSMTEVVNYLSRASYATKLWYVDQLLWAVQQQACTVRLANWILKQLEKIALNPEHKNKVSDLKSDLKHGRIKVKNANIKKQKNFSVQKILFILALTLISVFTIWIIWEEPFSKSDEDLFANETAYEQFSKAERKKIDSLLRDLQKERSGSDNQIDPNLPIYGSGISLVLQSPLKNAAMDKVYKDLVIDAELHDQGLLDTCVTFSKKEALEKRYNGFSDAKKHNGSVATMLKNESDYDVYLFIFENNKQGQAFSCLIKKGSTLEIQLNIKDHLLFVAGNSLGKFIPPISTSELPSNNFDHHFCSVDVNYSESLSNFYYLANPQSGKNKLLLSGDKNGYFSVIDLYGVLELM